MLNTFKVANEFTTVKELRISILEDEKIGTYTINDEVTIKGLVKIFHMTSNYNSDGDISKMNLEKKDFIYAILKDAEKELKEIFPNEVIDITSSMEDEIKKVRKMLIGDSMKWTILDEKTIDKMSLEEFEKCGTIAETSKEDVDFEFDNLKGVFFKIIELGVNLFETEAFKQSKEEWFKSDITEEEFFLDVFFERLQYEGIVFKENKDIIIEHSVIECSFGYDYGSISSYHTEYGTIGYNVFVKDVE